MDGSPRTGPQRDHRQHLPFICLADTYDEAKRIAAADLSCRYNQPFEKIADRYVAMGNTNDCTRHLADFAEAGVELFILVPIVRAFADFTPHVEAYARMASIAENST